MSGKIWIHEPVIPIEITKISFRLIRLLINYDCSYLIRNLVNLNIILLTSIKFLARVHVTRHLINPIKHLSPYTNKFPSIPFSKNPPHWVNIIYLLNTFLPVLKCLSSRPATTYLRQNTVKRESIFPNVRRRSFLPVFRQLRGAPSVVITRRRTWRIGNLINACSSLERVTREARHTECSRCKYVINTISRQVCTVITERARARALVSICLRGGGNYALRFNSRTLDITHRPINIIVIAQSPTPAGNIYFNDTRRLSRKNDYCAA